MKQDKYLNQIVRAFSQIDDVEAILLGGSFASGEEDKESDYDVYVYSRKEPSLKMRKALFDNICDYIEVDNRYWEPGDEGVLKNGRPVDIIYRTPKWIENDLKRVVDDHEAAIGYTTCIWHNFKTSKILFDRNDWAKKLQQKYDVAYPKQLKQNIIDKNLPLLWQAQPSYPNQILKAQRRNDLVAINHRIAAFLASYFDILFAVNEMTHPGEKKMLDVLERDAKKLPGNMRSEIEHMQKQAAENSVGLLDEIQLIVHRLEKVLN